MDKNKLVLILGVTILISVISGIGINHYFMEKIGSGISLDTTYMEASATVQETGEIVIWAYDNRDGEWYVYSPGSAPDSLSLTRYQYYSIAGVWPFI